MFAIAKKVLGGDAERRSRFHTRRGVRLTRGFIHAATGRAHVANEPWMAPSAVAALGTAVRPEMTLLELGSGASTAWYAARCAKVTSIEPDVAWAQRTAQATASFDHVSIVVSSVRDYLTTVPQDDVVVVDHLDEPDHTRVDSVRIAANSACSLVVLDDSDRAQYAECDQIMSEWSVQRYVGFKSRPLRPTETTIWTRRR